MQDLPTSRTWPWAHWYGFYWDYQQRTRSVYVGKQLSTVVELLVEQGPVDLPADLDFSSQ